MAHKILVVDDDPYIVKYIVGLLETNGYLTCSASDGPEALKVLEREKPDMVTLDLEMPQDMGTAVLPQDDPAQGLRGHPRGGHQRLGGHPSCHTQCRGLPAKTL